MPMNFEVQLESRQPKVYVKTIQYKLLFCCPKQGKKQYKLCPGEVTAYWRGARYLRKSLTLPWTRKLSESNSSSVLSV